jgi:exosortase
MHSQSQPSAFQRFSVSASLFLPLAWLWFVLINDLRVEWTVNPQYSYGWAVPFLCAFLFWQKIQQSAVSSQWSVAGASEGGKFQLSAFSFQLIFISLALLYAPTRLIEEANPGWRLVSWVLALEVVGLTLIFIRLALGASRFEVSGFRFQVSDIVFPVCFFLVAVPWPLLIEWPLIRELTRADTGITAELLGWLGIPAMPRGNVIEVATGVVGIDEACSGIRSFQATLMISLFLGEFYRLNLARRFTLVFAGFALSFFFNLARMSLLVWVAARKGVPAIASWHDPAGVTILVACFVCLWGLGVWFARRNGQKSEVKSQKPEGGMQPAGKAESGGLKSEIPVPSTFNLQLSTLRKLALAFGAWIVISEAGIEAWYRSHEARLPAAPQWTVAWPTNNPAFKELMLAGRTRQILRYDEGRSAGWQEGDCSWQAVFLRWKPGRTAIHLAQNHTPELCLTAAGYTLNTISPQEWFEVNGLRMPFSVNEVAGAPRPFFVFYCLWDDRAAAQGFEIMYLTYGNRLASALAGLRNPGQRSLEIAVTGPDNADEAEAALRGELNKLIVSRP